MTEPERDLTVPEVAERLRVNPETIRRWLRSGRLRGYSLGSDRGGWRIPAGEVERIRSGGAGVNRADRVRSPTPWPVGAS